MPVLVEYHHVWHATYRNLSVEIESVRENQFSSEILPWVILLDQRVLLFDFRLLRPLLPVMRWWMTMFFVLSLYWNVQYPVNSYRAIAVPIDRFEGDDSQEIGRHVSEREIFEQHAMNHIDKHEQMQDNADQSRVKYILHLIKIVNKTSSFEMRLHTNIIM